MDRTQFAFLVLAMMSLTACGDGAPERSSGAILADQICVRRSPKYEAVVSERDKSTEAFAQCESDAKKSSQALTEELNLLREEKVALETEVARLSARNLRMSVLTLPMTADKETCSSRVLAAMQDNLDQAEAANSSYNRGSVGSCKVMSVCSSVVDGEGRRSWSVFAACDDGSSPSDIINGLTEAVNS